MVTEERREERGRGGRWIIGLDTASFHHAFVRCVFAVHTYSPPRLDWFGFTSFPLYPQAMQYEFSHIKSDFDLCPPEFLARQTI